MRTTDGAWHRPRWPRQFCGFRPGAVEVFRALPFTPVADRPAVHPESLPPTDPGLAAHPRP